MIHHSANLAAITIPAISLSLNGPAILTYVTGILGAVWYLILISEKFFAWRARRHVAIHSKHRDNQSDNDPTV